MLEDWMRSRDVFETGEEAAEFLAEEVKPTDGEFVIVLVPDGSRLRRDYVTSAEEIE